MRTNKNCSMDKQLHRTVYVDTITYQWPKFDADLAKL